VLAQGLRREQVLAEQGLNAALKLLALVTGQVAGRDDQDGDGAPLRPAADLLDNFQAAQLRHQHVQQDQVGDAALQGRQRFLAVGCFFDRRSFRGQHVAQQFPGCRVVVHHQDAEGPVRLEQVGVQLAETVQKQIAVDRLEEVLAHCQVPRRPAVLGDADHDHRDRGRLRMDLQVRQHLPAVQLRQADVEDDELWPELPGLLQASFAVGRQHRPQAGVFQPVGQQPARRRIVLDHQRQRALGAVGLCLVRGLGRQDARQDEGEGASLAHGAFQADLSPQQMHQPAGQGQAQTRALRLFGAKGKDGIPRVQVAHLAKLVPHHLLMLGRDADAGVLHRHAHRGCLALADGPGVQRGPIDPLASDCHPAAGRRELDRVGQQVVQHLAEAARVGVQGAVGLDRAHRQGDAPRSGERPQRGRQAGQRLGQAERRGLDVHLAGLDLREIEDVVDQGQQVLAGLGDVVDVVGLLGRQHPKPLRRQHARHPDDRVERGAQLVAHPRQELALGPAGRLGFLLGLPQRRLFLALGDVRAGPDPLADHPAAGDDGHTPAVEPAIGAVPAAQAILRLEQRVSRHRAVPGEDRRRTVVGMDGVQPAPPEDGLDRLPSEGAPGGEVRFDLAPGVGGPEDVRDGAQVGAVALFLVLQGGRPLRQGQGHVVEVDDELGNLGGPGRRHRAEAAGHQLARGLGQLFDRLGHAARRGPGHGQRQAQSQGQCAADHQRALPGLIGRLLPALFQQRLLGIDEGLDGRFQLLGHRRRLGKEVPCRLLEVLTGLPGQRLERAEPALDQVLPPPFQFLQPFEALVLHAVIVDEPQKRGGALLKGLPPLHVLLRQRGDPVQAGPQHLRAHLGEVVLKVERPVDDFLGVLLPGQRIEESRDDHGGNQHHCQEQDQRDARVDQEASEE
jgi:hypothetical protein